MKAKNHIFIGAAWPYANGFLHLGHIAALLPADILARYYRLKGDRVLFVSGSDCYGTPITVTAEKEGISPQEVAEKYDRSFRQDLITRLGFSYDFYSRTTSKIHSQAAQEIFLDLLNKGLIYEKVQELPFCEQCQRFLPDRYIEGKCPDCGFENARGDQCDNCGHLLDAKNLLNPKCKLCLKEPQWKESTHFFFKLSAFQKQLQKWVKPQTDWRPNAYQFTLSALKQGLPDRPITRDTDWGVEVPLPGYEKKRIYVWFEALCGYVSASKGWADSIGDKELWRDFWEKDCWHYYVHGKDNILFHTIVWPAILMAKGGLNLPNCIISSELLNLEGKQFSKSRNWAVWLPDFLNNYSADSLRYYLTSNGPETMDADFAWENYRLRNNSELVGNYGNFAHRVLDFVYKKFEGKIPKRGPLDKKDNDFLKSCENVFKQSGKNIEQGKLRAGLKEIFGLAEQGNRYLQDKAPWQAIKNNREKAETALNVCLQVILNLQILTSPFLPFSSAKLKSFFKPNNSPDIWEFQEIPKNLTFTGAPVPLYEQIEKEKIAQEIEKLKKGS